MCERWALLIVRDLLVGPRCYGELASGLPRIPSNILAARLKELQAAGILRRVPNSHVIVYELPPYGLELGPVVLALGAWGFKEMGDPRQEQIITPDSMMIDLRTAFRSDVAANLPATAYSARLGPAELLIQVDGSALDATGEPTGPSTSRSQQVRTSAGSSPASSLRIVRSRPAWSKCCAVVVSSSTASRPRSTWPPDPNAVPQKVSLGTTKTNTWNRPSSELIRQLLTSARHNGNQTISFVERKAAGRRPGCARQDKVAP